MSTRSTLATIKRIAAVLIAIAIVLAAGILVGQAPALFDVDEDPEASITFEDQERDGTNVTINEVALSDGGFVVISDNDGETIAVSEYLGEGTHENVTIELDEDADRELVGQLTATAHQDTTDDSEFAYDETEGAEDQPYLAAGYPVSDTATVTTTDDAGLPDSFAVESIDAPATATTNQTVTIGAEIRNPTANDLQQPVEFRLDGAVMEQQLLDLEAEETREVTFEIDTRGTEPGERTVGVYTDADGALETIDFEFHTDPAVTVTDADSSSVTADVATPTESFVAIEDNETETILGTSDVLEPGERENVTVDFEESVDEDEELIAVLYEGDPDDIDPATASPVEHDDEPVETTFTVGDVGADSETEGEGEDGDEDGDDADAAADEGGGDDGEDAGDGENDG